MKIESVLQFLQSISDNHSEQVYRGQAKEEWLLLPSIARINVTKLPSQYPEGWRGVERDILNRFKKHAIRFMNREPQTKIDWMIQAQHHGVPTRLLDWSTSPLKALYFAVENSHHDDFDGVVFVFFPSSWRTSQQDVNGDEELVLTAFHPHFINERVAAQDGCFTLFPFPQSNDLRPITTLETGFSPQNDVISIQKIVIDKDAKGKIRKQLKQLGITDVSMFPDLDGVAKGICREFTCL